jgi:hypothetical protein
MLSPYFKPSIARWRLAVLVDAFEISPKLCPVDVAAMFPFVPRDLHHFAAAAFPLGLVRKARGLGPFVPRRRHGERFSSLASSSRGSVSRRSRHALHSRQPSEKPTIKPPRTNEATANNSLTTVP